MPSCAKAQCKKLPSPGELRESIVVTEPDTSQLGDYGELAGPPLTLFSTRAKIEDLRGTELDQARQLYASATMRVTMYNNRTIAFERWSDFVLQWQTTPANRTLYVGYAACPDPTRIWLELLVGEER